MKVLVYADTAEVIPRFESAFADSGCVLAYVIANNRELWPPRFWLTVGAGILRAVLLSPSSLAIRALIAGRLRISPHPLAHPATSRVLERIAPDLGLHAMGIIYSETTIRRSGRGILNAHIGKLPEFRGRSVMEWSLFFGQPTGTTVFFVDAGIDTGRTVVFFEPIDVSGYPRIAEAKAHLYRQDARLYRRAADHLSAGLPLAINDLAGGKRYYVMSDLLASVVSEALG